MSEDRKKCFIQSYGVIDNSNTVTISLFLTCWELCWFPQLDVGPIHVWNPPTPLHWNVDHRQLDVHILYWNKVLMVELVVEIFLVFWKLNINKSSQQDSNDHSPLNLFRHRQYTNRALLNPQELFLFLYRDHDLEGWDMMAVRSLLKFLAYSYCLVDVHVFSSLAGLGWQLDWTGLPVQIPDTNYK